MDERLVEVLTTILVLLGTLAANELRRYLSAKTGVTLDEQDEKAIRGLVQNAMEMAEEWGHAKKKRESAPPGSLALSEEKLDLAAEYVSKRRQELSKRAQKKVSSPEAIKERLHAELGRRRSFSGVR